MAELSGPLGARLPLGRPLESVQAYVLDGRLEPVPIGMVGEICLGGVQVGRGYLNLPERTARSFVHDPFRDVHGARLYRTGDLGRMRPDGTLEFLGRTDGQINLRGHRIEPGEIASLLEQHPLVKHAAVVAREDQPGSPRLVAYVVPKSEALSGGGLDEARRAIPAWQGFLRHKLPAYMLPAAFVVLDALPTTVQGKLDRRALPAPATATDSTARYVAPRSDHERLVAAVWEKLLGVDDVGATDNFFDLGGHSVLAVQVIAAIEERTGRRLPLASLFHQATVEHLARLLDEPESCPAESSLAPLQTEGSGRPFFCIHPAGGTVFCYRALAEHLGKDRPFYGLQAVGVDGVRAPHTRVEDMAAHYAAAIRGVQPAGPYLLGGWSLGGILAFETARLLIEQGQRVGLLALFDAAALHSDRPPHQSEFLPMIMDFFPGLENVPLEEIQAMEPQRQLQYFLDRASQAEIVAAARDFEGGRHVFEVFKTSIQAILDYRQKPYPGKVTLFVAEHDKDVWDPAGLPALGWESWAAGGVEVHPSAGNHIRMIHPPHVEALARALRDCLRQAD